MRKRKKTVLRKMRKPVKGPFLPHMDAHKKGDRVISAVGTVYDIRVGNGHKHPKNKNYPALAQAQLNGAVAVEIDGVWYWDYAAEGLKGT